MFPSFMLQSLQGNCSSAIAPDFTTARLPNAVNFLELQPQWLQVFWCCSDLLIARGCLNRKNRFFPITQVSILWLSAAKDSSTSTLYASLLGIILYLTPLNGGKHVSF
ncbi:unnamed protein product [Cylicocyclus nassatus]|uniref:Uncharacterized protein n=1 Tax=Cylicocyclus nassatus TaxID=53992 RepID=A0AA36DLT8_CYLNA|nr:unnamed protein product [Cylicocyclus nassatus]